MCFMSIAVRCIMPIRRRRNKSRSCSSGGIGKIEENKKQFYSKKEGSFHTRNEMRGFFFLSYALFCFAIYYLSGGFYYGGGNIWIGLAAIFLIIGIAFLSNAGPSRAEKSHSEKHAVLHIGQSWSEFNRFQLKVNSVAMKRGEDGQRLCDVMFHVENWLPLLQQGENTISVQLTATAEHGKESIEVKMLNGNNITVAADENKGTSYTMTLPEKTERVLLKFSVIPEHDEKIYQRQYAFYPAHYEK